MGIINLIYFLCVKERFARNLLLLSNTNIIVSGTYLSTFVKDNNRNKFANEVGFLQRSAPRFAGEPTPLFSNFSQQTFRYSYSTLVKQNKIHPISP